MISNDREKIITATVVRIDEILRCVRHGQKINISIEEEIDGLPKIEYDIQEIVVPQGGNND